MLFGARACDVIWHYKTDNEVSLNPDQIRLLKYREILMATVNDALEILGYGRAENIELKIFSITHGAKNN
jgi:hypothetical protein